MECCLIGLCHCLHVFVVSTPLSRQFMANLQAGAWYSSTHVPPCLAKACASAVKLLSVALALLLSLIDSL